MKSILLSFLLLFCLKFGFGQCPTSVSQISGSGSPKCLVLNYGSTPLPPYPGTITFGGTTYTRDTGPNVNPAEYKTNNCSGGSSLFSGSIVVGGVTCTYVDNILPINLLSLNVALKDKVLKVALIVENDEPDVKVLLSASADAEAWTTLPWTSTNNTEGFLFNYIFDDLIPTSQNFHYIKVEGKKLDGSVTFSKISKIDGVQSKSFDIYPNPSQNGIYNMTCASCSDQSALIEVYSPEGRKISTGTAANSAYTIDLSKATNGVYIVKMIQDGETVTKRVLKMN